MYEIAYDLDGGTIAEGSNPDSYTYEDEDIDLNNPTKEGHTFAGWTGTGLTEATKEVTIAKGSTGDRTYTAQWQEKMHTVTFNANGGTGSKDDQQIGEATKKPLSENTFTRTGYTFLGWSEDSNASTATYSDKQEITVSRKALWQKPLASPPFSTKTDKSDSWCCWPESKYESPPPATHSWQ